MGRTDAGQLSRLLRGDLDWITMKALEKDRARRYGSPAELADELERYLRNEPVQASPPSAVYRLSKLARRNRGALLAGALVVVALALGAFGTQWWLGWNPAAAIQPSIAVLPFANLSGDPGNDYFSDGVSDHILSALAELDGVRVAAGTSSFAFKGKDQDIRQIGSALNVATVLEGSVHRAGNKLSVAARLIDTSDGLGLWSRTFEREAEDVFEVQEEITRAVADALKVKLLEADSSGGRASDYRAYDLYLQGRHLLRQRSPSALSEAVELFRQAIAIDAEFAPAYTGLADGYGLLSRFADLPMDYAQREARSALERALLLNGELPEAHASLGRLLSYVGDLPGAELALRRAIELNANHAEAHLMLGLVVARQKRPEEADAAYERALSLDPLNPKSLDAVAATLTQRGNYDEGMQHFERRLRIEPQSAETYRVMAIYARAYGRLEDAIAWGRRAVEIDPQGPLNLNELAMAYAILGEFDEATRWIDRAYELAPNNHWVVVIKAFDYIQRGDFESLEAYTRAQLALSPALARGPLPQVTRVRLALAGISKVYARDYEAATRLLEQALGQPYTPILELQFDANLFSYLAYAYLELGQADQARAASEQCLALVRKRDHWVWTHLVMADTLAGIHAIQGRDAEALATLKQAVADGWTDYKVLRYAPHWKRLRSRPEFQQLMTELKAKLERMRDRVMRAESPNPT